MHRQRHQYLGDDIRRGEDGGQHEVDDYPVHPELGQFLVVEHADLDQKQDDDRQLEGEAHADHEFTDELDVVFRTPHVGPEVQPVGEERSGAERDLHQQEITKRGSKEKQPASDDDGHGEIFFLLLTKCWENKLPEEIQDEWQGDHDTSIKRHLQRHEKSAEWTHRLKLGTGFAGVIC